MPVFELVAGFLVGIKKIVQKFYDPANVLSIFLYFIQITLQMALCSSFFFFQICASHSISNYQESHIHFHLFTIKFCYLENYRIGCHIHKIFLTINLQYFKKKLEGLSKNYERYKNANRNWLTFHSCISFILPFTCLFFREIPGRKQNSRTRETH